MSKINELIQTLCPDGVEYKSLKDLYEYRRGSFPQPYTNMSFYGGDNAAPFVQVADVCDDGFCLVDKTKQTISKIAQPKSVFVKKGTVIVTLQGTIGRVAITQYDAYVDRTLAIFTKCKVSDLNKRYFSYCLKSIFDEKKKLARGSTIKTITKEEFSEFEIPVPPRPVQDEIVRILDEYTDLEAELEAKLSEEIELKQKQYMFLTSELIDKLESDSVVPLESVCGVYDGTHSTPQYTDSGVRFVSVENINDLYGSKKFISEEAYEKFKIKPQIGDVFMTRIGTMGKCAIVDRDEPLGYYVSLALLRPDSTVLSSEYLRWYLESGAGWKELEARTLWNATPIKINKGEIGKMLIKVPSLAVQDVVVKKIKAYYDAKTSLLTLLNTELESRKKQYAYYRDQLLTFKRKQV